MSVSGRSSRVGNLTASSRRPCKAISVPHRRREQGGKLATSVIAAAADIKFRVAESRCNSALIAISHSVSYRNRRPANNVERTAAKASSAVYDKSVL